MERGFKKFKVTYSSSDKSINISLNWNVNTRMVKNYAGKSWPIHTQCILFVNGLIETVSTIRLHANDTHDEVQAMRISAQKAIDMYNTMPYIKHELITSLENQLADYAKSKH